MQFGNPHCAGSRLPGSETGLRPDEHVARLLAVAKVARTWLERIQTHDPHREQVQRMGILAEDLAGRGSPTPSALAAIRAMLCANCRRLDGFQGDCSGQVLERCPLLVADPH